MNFVGVVIYHVNVIIIILPCFVVLYQDFAVQFLQVIWKIMRFGPAPHGWMGLKPAENGIKIKKTYIATNFGISQLSLILPTKQTCNDTVGALNHFRIKVLCLFRSYSAVSIVKLYDIYIYAANYCFVRTSWNKGTYASLSDCACVRLKESFSILFFELGWERNWNSIFGSRGGEKTVSST